MQAGKSLFWFRQDLRVHDNPGLVQAVSCGRVQPIYIWDDTSCSSRMGAAGKWWLHHSLQSLDASLQNKLNIYCGKPKDVITQLVARHDFQSVFWNRCYEPHRIQEDTDIKHILKNMGVHCQSFNGSLLWEPWEISKKDGSFYKVYTSFYRYGCLQSCPPRDPLPSPNTAHLIKDTSSLSIHDMRLIDTVPWHQGWSSFWHVGEKGAIKSLQEFIEANLDGYKKKRDFPSLEHTSRLSPHLHFGEISPHRVWYEVRRHALKKGMSQDVDHFMGELAWREFSYYLLYHFPDLSCENFNKRFDAFPWQNHEIRLRAWQKGQTGYPIVDAGMRELWQTGYMHNRVRMIVASFLVKNLGIDWRRGAEWFWDCLVDADLANNSASWQWVAGSGADAAPYFRIFNPVLQGEKFDPNGAYTRRYVPELALLPDKFLFSPWQAPTDVLQRAGVQLGGCYPHPIVDMKESRDKALQAYKSLGPEATNR